MTASPEIAKLHTSYRMFVDGTFTEGGGARLATINPSTGEVLAEVSTASGADVDSTVRVARRAYDRVWSRMAGAERAKYLFRIARLVQERARELAVLESLDTGRPIRASRDTLVPAAAAHFFYHAGWADKLAYAGYGPDPRPLGIAGQIIGPDAALLTAAQTIAPALACGNTVVLKPADTTPLTALVLADICQQAGLPAGVLNVLPGASDVGAALVAHDGVNQVAFTGSAEVGRQVQRALAGTGRRLTLSLRGSLTSVVFDDAPLQQAVDGIVTEFLAAGTGTRLLVAEPIAQELLAALRASAAGLRVGDPLDEGTDVGAVNSNRRLTRIRELSDRAEADGAQRWTSPAPLPEHGYYYSPTVFSDVSRTMRIAQEEIVGPVLAVLTFATPDHAATSVGNIPHVARFDPTVAFGGYRESGPGCVGGRAGLAAYLDV